MSKDPNERSKDAGPSERLSTVRLGRMREKKATLKDTLSEEVAAVLE